MSASEGGADSLTGKHDTILSHTVLRLPGQLPFQGHVTAATRTLVDWIAEIATTGLAQ